MFAVVACYRSMQIAKTGWQKSNPAYEEHYKQNILVTDTSTFGAGWVYPALFHSKNTWYSLPSILNSEIKTGTLVVSACKSSGLKITNPL